MTSCPAWCVSVPPMARSRSRSMAVSSRWVPAKRRAKTLATVLAGIAEKVSEIDVARAQAAKAAAEAEIAAESRGEGDVTANVMARAALERAELRLAAAKS